MNPTHYRFITTLYRRLFFNCQLLSNEYERTNERITLGVLLPAPHYPVEQLVACTATSIMLALSRLQFMQFRHALVNPRAFTI